MDNVKQLSAELSKLTPDDIRVRLAELHAEEKSLRVVLRAVLAAERMRRIQAPLPAKEAAVS